MDMNDDNDIQTDEADDEESDNSPRMTSSSRSMSQSNNQQLVSKQSLYHLISDIYTSSYLFKQCADDHPIELCIEGFIGIAYLASMKPKFYDLLPVVHTAIIELSTYSEKLFMLTFKV